jgi:beta-lactamase class A
MSVEVLKRLVHTFPGEMGVYAKNLKTNATVAINGNTPFYLASIAKVPIMIGAVDAMNRRERLDDEYEIEPFDYREEGKCYRYHHIGTKQKYRNLLRTMIRCSDTTATDMVMRIAGHEKVNRTLRNLNIDGLSEVTSIAELDRIVRAVYNDTWAEIPAYAFEPYSRDGNSQLLIPAYLNKIPGSNDSAAEAYQQYYATGLNSATPRAMGILAERLAEETLLAEPWKNDVLREEIFTAGGEGAIGKAVPNVRLVDSKGGAKYRVRCELGIVYSGGVPEAVIGVFTQKHDIPRNDVGSIIKEAANLAYKAIGFSHTIAAPTLSNPGLVFVEPPVGQLYEPGTKPPIRWKSQGVSGRLTLQLVRTSANGDETVVDTFSNNVIDDGEWHSWSVPSSITPATNYRLKLFSNADPSVQAYSPYFALRGVIRALEPHLGENHPHGDKPRLRWSTYGVTGRLTLELLKGSSKVLTISTNAIDDGEWHSWEVPNSLKPDDDYRIRITSNTDPSVVGYSPNFTVGGKIAVSRPNLGDAIAIGDKPRIRWQSSAIEGNLRIRLRRGEATLVQTISDNALNDGEWHSWQVPESLKDGGGYRIEVSDRDNGALRGYSHYFQIGARLEWLIPSLEQRPFNGDDHVRPHYFAYGTTPTLRWRTHGTLAGRLRLELLRDGKVVEVITSNAIDDGEWHSWTVSRQLPASSRYQFRLQSLERQHAIATSQYFQLGALIDITLPYSENGTTQLQRLSQGDRPKIRWRTENISGNLRLELYRQDDVALLIHSNALNDGEWHSWSVPSNLKVGRGYRLKLTSRENSDVFGFSPWFSIDD